VPRSGSGSQLRRQEAGWRAEGSEQPSPKQPAKAAELDTAVPDSASLLSKGEARGQGHAGGVPIPRPSGDHRERKGAWSERGWKVA